MGQVDILTGIERRRHWRAEEKQALVAAAFAPGAVVADVAQQADVRPSQLYRWRRELRHSAGFAEVLVTQLPGIAGTASAAVIEISLGDMQIRLPGTASPDLAAAILSALVRR